MAKIKIVPRIRKYLTFHSLFLNIGKILLNDFRTLPSKKCFQNGLQKSKSLILLMIFHWKKERNGFVLEVQPN